MVGKRGSILGLPHGSQEQQRSRPQVTSSAPRRALHLSRAVRGRGSIHVSGPATKTPPQQKAGFETCLSRNHTPTPGASTSAVHEAGTTGSAHVASGRSDNSRRYSRREAASATFDAVGTRAYHERRVEHCLLDGSLPEDAAARQGRGAPLDQSPPRRVVVEKAMTWRPARVSAHASLATRTGDNSACPTTW